MGGTIHVPLLPLEIPDILVFVGRSIAGVSILMRSRVCTVAWGIDDLERSAPF